MSRKLNPEAEPELEQQILKKVDIVLERLNKIDRKVENLRHQIADSANATRSQSFGLHSRIKASHDNLPSEVVELLALRNNLVDQSIPMPSLGGWPLGAATTVRICRRIEAKKCSGNILELGGGSSTIWMAEAIRSSGYEGTIVSVDHDPHFLQQTANNLRVHGLEQFVELIHAPIGNIEFLGESREWYSINESSKLHDIGVLVVDGPPGSTDTEARLPSLYFASKFFTRSAWVYFDDCHRNDEKAIIRKWLKDFPQLKLMDQIGDTQEFKFEVR